MNQVNIEDVFISATYGNIYARKWMPESIESDIPIILLHDSLGSVDLWRDFPAHLSENLSRTVIAYDRLGFGRSDARYDSPSHSFIEEEAEKYFPEVKSGLMVSKYNLLGHSVGGGMAINIASRDMDCQSLVTISSQAFVEKLTIKGIKSAKRKFKEPGQLKRLEKWHGEKALWVLKAWTNIWLSPDFADWSLDTCIGNVFCPVLSIHGERDEYGSKAFAEFIVTKTSGISKILILEDCGHMPHKEKKDVVIENVKGFIRSLQ